MATAATVWMTAVADNLLKRRGQDLDFDNFYKMSSGARLELTRFTTTVLESVVLTTPHSCQVERTVAQHVFGKNK